MGDVTEPKRVLTDAGDDITEAVQILYDIAHSSMDWGSGFLDNAEMATVIGLAVKMGWEVPDLPYTLRDSAIASVALEFPDQYKVTEVHHPKSAYGEAFTSHRIEKVNRA